MCAAIEAIVPALEALTPELMFGGIADTGYMEEGMFEQFGAFLWGIFAILCLYWQNVNHSSADGGKRF